MRAGTACEVRLSGDPRGDHRSGVRVRGSDVEAGEDATGMTVLAIDDDQMVDPMWERTGSWIVIMAPR